MKTKESAFRPFEDYNDEEYTVFKVKQSGGPVGYRSLGDNIYGAVTLERNLSLFKTSWSVDNNAFEWLGTLGGMLVILWIIMFAFEFMMTYKKFQNYMASELYHVPENLDVADNLEKQITGNNKKGCCAPGGPKVTRKRMHIPRDFHNEIIDED